MLKRFLIAVPIIVVLVVISFISRSKTNFILEEGVKEEQPKEEIIIKLKDENNILDLKLEEYIIGVVACEMPASFNIEALKAQALAARTFALRKYEARKEKKYTLTNSTSDQCYHDETIMKKKWKSNYNKYYEKIKKAVYETTGEYLTYNDDIITAFYFSMSNGYTEYSENVFSSSRPYLVSVSSTWDMNIKNYEKKVAFSESDFLSKLGIKDKNINSLNINSRYETNRVKEIEINGIKYSGVKFRTLLSLRSTDFDIKRENDKVIITTRGYGHGVGMSQYGANAMANEGYSYDEIVKYYYKNVEIKKV